MKQALFVESYTEEAPVREFLSAHPQAGVYSTDPLIVRRLNEKGIAAQWLGEFTPGADVEGSDLEAIRLAREWYRGLPEALINYRGVNLAALVEYSFGTFLINTFRRRRYFQDFLKANPGAQITLMQAGETSVRSLYWKQEENFSLPVLRSLGINFQIRSAGRAAAGAPRETFKQLARSAWESLRALKPLPAKKGGNLQNILFCSAPQHMRDIAGVMKGSGRLFYLDESFQFSKRKILPALGAEYLTFAGLAKRLKAKAERGAFLSGWKSRRKVFLAGLKIFEAARPKIEYFIDVKIPELCLQIDVFYEFLPALGIQSVMVDEDTIEFRKCLVITAQKLGIPSLVVLHAAAPSFCRGFDLAPLAASYLAVGGEGIKKDCVELGIPQERVLVTGIPRYDSSISSRRDKAFGPEVVVLAGTTVSPTLDMRGDWRDIEAGYKDFFGAMKNFPDKRVIVKLYPGDVEAAWVRRAAAEAGLQNVSFLEKEVLLEVLKEADIVVSFFSSAVTEAFLLNKPTVVLDYLSRIPRFSVFLNAPGSQFSVKDKESLKNILSKLFSRDVPTLKAAEETARTVAREWAGVCDGNASKRVGEALRRLASEKFLESA